ncbi:hypothetical protein DA075_10035 [Methylobacterium currus]|uniref:Uncharacterized protein n=1 Tax=Methylobacterium currus TaxID=2051553 RepID=A0A2R4WI42_9HYPH|nr:hypothetical protein [Methylobacterium currus]AWB21211.1 hypothetical protein DA075_10035 [Methylobacterium currus]
MRPELLTNGHSRHITDRVRTLPAAGRLPPLRVDEVLTAQAANDDRTSLVRGFFILGLVIATFIALGVAAFLIGRGW